MDAMTGTDGAKTGGDAALRVMNLLFALNTSRHPLTTEQIVSDSDMGYGSANRDSDLKKFRRDREKLAEQGIVVREVRESGAAQTEESSWRIDREATHADAALLLPEDAEALLDAIDEHLRRPDIPYRAPLKRIQLKVRELLGQEGSSNLDAIPGTDATIASDGDPIADTVWGAYALQKTLPFLYRDAAGNETRRTVAIYGIFSLDGHAYFTGKDDWGKLRTFRIDRVQRVWRAKTPYRIPADFSVSDHLFLPFDLAEGAGVEASFLLPEGIGEAERASLARGHGAFEQIDAGFIWRVQVRDVDAAAAFALEHAHTGLRPVGPSALMDSWKRKLKEAMAAHV